MICWKVSRTLVLLKTMISFNENLKISASLKIPIQRVVLNNSWIIILFSIREDENLQEQEKAFSTRYSLIIMLKFCHHINYTKIEQFQSCQYHIPRQKRACASFQNKSFCGSGSWTWAWLAWLWFLSNFGPHDSHKRTFLKKLSVAVRRTKFTEKISKELKYDEFP